MRTESVFLLLLVFLFVLAGCGVEPRPRRVSRLRLDPDDAFYYYYVELDILFLVVEKPDGTFTLISDEGNMQTTTVKVDGHVEVVANQEVLFHVYPSSPGSVLSHPEERRVFLPLATN